MSIALPDSSSASNDDAPSVKIKDSPDVVSLNCPASSQSEDDRISVAASETGKICSYFRKTGTCRFGVNCKFRHGDAPLNENVLKLSELSQKICYSFAKRGYCRFGEKCKFSHAVQKEEASASHEGSEESEGTQRRAADTKEGLVDESTEEAARDSAEGSVKKDTSSQSQTSKQSKPKVCRYYKRGSCKRGSSCTYAHPERKEGDSKGSNGDAKRGPNDGSLPPIKGKEERNTEPRPQLRPKVQLQTFLRLSELTEEDLRRLRETEIRQLKQRFPDLLEMENDDQPSIYRIVVQPTDPDWPYDLREFQLNVCLPYGYPAEPPLINLPEDQDVPAVILRSITDGVQEWIQAKHEMNRMAGRVELIVRPFLRWLDRNLESKFTEGARKYKRELDVERAGFQFISNVKESTDVQQPTQPTLPENAVIISKPKGEESTDSSRHEDPKLPLDWTETGQSSGEDVEGGAVEEDEDDLAAKSDTSARSKAKSIVYDPPDKDLRGTEILFQGLNMTESVASLGVVKMTVIVQCSRCKESTDLTTPPRRNNLVLCGRCSNRQIITYRPCLVHPMSHVVGFLDLDGCLPFDVNLVTSTLVVGCLACSHDNTLKGIQYGQTRNLWCEKCHQKMTVQAESCRFQRLQPAENIGSGPLFTVPVKGPKKQPKDPAIVDMLPLPDNGSCKHYKKSFRWLRFPCCGKFYPCDECHDLDNAGDHEMKYATRMLCGFCAKEQPYSADKPCVRCGSATTKARTKHWEGGTGCRNRVRMSKNDKQKYAGTNKTVSKKAQDKAKPSKKGKS